MRFSPFFRALNQTPKIVSVAEVVPLLDFSTDIIPSRNSSASLWLPDYGLVGSTLYWFNLNEARLLSRDGNAMPGGEDGVLTEGAGENIITFSEEFDNAAWTKTGASATADQATAPDGTNTADLLVINPGSNARRISQTFTSAANHYSASVSVFIRSTSSTETAIRIGITGKDGVLRLTDDITVSAGWTRISASITVGSGSGTPEIDFRAKTAADQFPYYIWGAQVESGSNSFITSYIRTTGSTSVRATDAGTISADSGSLAFDNPNAFVVNVAPGFSYDEALNSATPTRIFAWGGGNVSFGIFGNIVAQTRVRCFTAVGSIQSGIDDNMQTFSRGTLLSMSVNTGSGQFVVQGNDLADGTAWGWPSGQIIRVGHFGSAINHPFFGIIGEPVERE